MQHKSWNAKVQSEVIGLPFLKLDKEGVWADAVKRGYKKLENVPNLSILIDIVTQLVEGGEQNV